MLCTILTSYKVIYYWNWSSLSFRYKTLLNKYSAIVCFILLKRFCLLSHKLIARTSSYSIGILEVTNSNDKKELILHISFHKYLYKHVINILNEEKNVFPRKLAATVHVSTRLHPRISRIFITYVNR